MTLPQYDGAPEPTVEKLQGSGGSRLKAGLAVVAVVGILVVGLASSGTFSGRDAGLASGKPSAAADGPDGSAGPADSGLDAATPSPAATVFHEPYVATPPTSYGLIAVVDDQGHLSTMDDGGGSLITYDVPEIKFGFPAWSPDGTRIAVVGTGPDDTAVYVFDVYVFTVPREQPTGLAHPKVIYRSAQTPPFYVYWLPSGHGVGMLASEATGISLRFVPADSSLPLDGSGPEIVQQGSPLYFTWTENGTALVHVGLGMEAFTGEIAIDDPTASSGLVARPGSGTFRAPAVTTDGKFVAFTQKGTDGHDRLVVERSDARVHREAVVNGPTAFGFDAVADRLAWISSAGPVDADKFYPVGPLKLMDPTSGKIRTLVNEPVVAFFWSPGGQTIAALLPAQPGDDELTTASTASLTADTPGAPLRLEFIDVRTGMPRGERVVRLAPEFVNALIPYFDQYAMSHSLWSLDGTSIVLPMVDLTGRNQIVVVPADGTDPRAIADGDKAFWSH